MRLIAAWATLIVLLSAAAGSAQSRTSSLSWVRLDGAESCIAGAELARSVEARLGRTVFVATSRAVVAVEGRAEHLSEGTPRWRAVLRMTDTHGALIGDRVVESPAATCDELGRIAVVAIALMIDPVTAATPVEAVEPSPPVAVDTPLTPTRREPAHAEAAPAESTHSWRFELDAALIGALGLVPGVGLGGLSAFTAEPPSFVPLVAEGTLLPFARVNAAGVRADFLRVVGGLQVCPLVWRPGRITLLSCVGVDVGALFVVDTSQALREREKVLVEGHLVLRGHWRVAGPLVLRAGLHLLVPFRQVAFVTAATPSEEVYAPPSVAGMLDLAVGLEL